MDVGPALGVRLVIAGTDGAVTVKLTPFDAPTEVVTTTLPVVAPDGTVQVRDVLLQLPHRATVPLKVTVELPCVAPKWLPAIVVDELITPAFGDTLDMIGRDVTVKLSLLLVTPPTVTMTGPVVAPTGTVQASDGGDHTLHVAAVPLKETTLPSCEAPKVVPLITTLDPT